MSRAGTVSIVTGCPGAGKTTLCRSICEGAPDTVLITGDTFFEWIALPVDPSRPESSAQNHTVIQAQARTADAYARGGYRVVLEGIIGPWFVAEFCSQLSAARSVSYVILMPDLDEAAARAASRAESPASPAMTRKMHEEFMRDTRYRHHRLDVTGLNSDEAARRLTRALASPGFLIR